MSNAGADGASEGGADVWDAVVLGAGISGLVAADVLLEKGAGRVLVVDAYDRVGGNHLDATIGPYTYDVGSLIFQDDSPLVRRFPEILPGYVAIRPSWARLTPRGSVAEYPFDVREDVVRAGPWEWALLAASAAAARMSRRPLRTAEDFAHHWIGPRMVRRSGLGNYMERFCGSPAAAIDIEFAQSRMMWIAEQASGRALLARAIRIVRSAPPDPARNTQLVRPVEGFEALYAPIARRLTEAGASFALGRPPDVIRRVGDGFEIEIAGRVHRAARVFSTIPVDHALELCGIPGSTALPTVTLISLYFSFQGVRGFRESILYNFSYSGHWKRLTVYSDFYGERGGREYFAVEVVCPPGGLSELEAEAGFREQVTAVGLFDGDLVLEGSQRLGHAYPLYTAGSGDRARRARQRLGEFGVDSFGRQGGFEYQPTARVSTQHAEAAMDGVPVARRVDDSTTSSGRAAPAEHRDVEVRRAPQGRASVIIANYNYARYLGHAIDSALALDWDDVEVVVVDDGSTDGSRAVLESYGDRIRVLLQENSTQRVARNRGFAMSTGSVIVHLDSDDVLEPELLRAAAEVWTPTVAKVQVQMYRIDEEGRRLGTVFPEFSEAPKPDQVRRWARQTTSYPTPPGSGNVYARWFLERIFPLDDSCGAATDSACLAAAPFFGDVVTVTRALVGYRVHGENTSEMTTDPRKFSAAIVRARQRHLYTLRVAPPSDAAVGAPDERPLRRSRPLLQLRVSAARMTPDLSGLPGDSRGRMLLDALRSPFHPGPETLGKRLVILVWSSTTLVAPAPLARFMVRKRYSWRRRGR